MPIYKDFDYGTVMGFYPGELEKSLKEEIFAEKELSAG